MQTVVASRPLPLAPPPDSSAGHPKRWSTRTRVAALAAVALVAAGAGVAVTLTRPGPTVEATTIASLNAKVTATGIGAVTVTWADEQNQPGFFVYVARQDGRVTLPQPLRGAAARLTLDGVPAGVHCYSVVAVFRGRLPAGLAPGKPTPECVTVH